MHIAHRITHSTVLYMTYAMLEKRDHMIQSTGKRQVHEK